MNHKTVVKIAIVMIIVFGAITILYPRLYAPKPESAPLAPVDTSAPPVAAPPPSVGH